MYALGEPPHAPPAVLLSVGPALRLFCEELLPYGVLVIARWPVFWLVDYCPTVGRWHAGYAGLVMWLRALVLTRR